MSNTLEQDLEIYDLRKKRVYCKDCRYLRHIIGNLIFIKCVVHVGHPNNINNDFKCPDYKRKWWKFWR